MNEQGRRRKVLVVIDELDGLVRVTSGQLAHVREHFDKGIISKQVDTVVVTRWRAERCRNLDMLEEGFVCISWVLRMAGEVPFAKCSGSISNWFTISAIVISFE